MSGWDEHGDERLDSPAVRRNREAVVAALSALLDGARGTLLEVGCGSGQHARALAEALPQLTVQPTDPDPRNVASARAWRRHGTTPANLTEAQRLDATARPWLEPDARFRAVFCANVVHISPWRVAEGLFAGAGEQLEAGGLLLLYGPFFFDGEPVAPSNVAFDASLRERDSRWGIRHAEALGQLARDAGLEAASRLPMPANNTTLAFRRPLG